MRSVMLTIAVLCTLSCGGSTAPTSAVTAAEAGTYALQSLNATLLPATVSEGGTQIEVTAGTLTLSAGNAVRINTTFRLPTGGASQYAEVVGTYRMQGDSLSFSYSNGGANGGRLIGTALQMMNEGVLWLYRRN